MSRRGLLLQLVFFLIDAHLIPHGCRRVCSSGRYTRLTRGPKVSEGGPEGVCYCMYSYTGPLFDDGALTAAVAAGLESQHFIELCVSLCERLKSLLELSEVVTPPQGNIIAAQQQRLCDMVSVRSSGQ